MGKSNISSAAINRYPRIPSSAYKGIYTMEANRGSGLHMDYFI